MLLKHFILQKIEIYFQKEGFNISIDEIIGIRKVFIDDIKLTLKKIKKDVPIFNSENIYITLMSLDTEIDVKFFNNNIVGYKIDYSIPPAFPAGTIWFVNTQKNPENDAICSV